MQERQTDVLAVRHCTQFGFTQLLHIPYTKLGAIVLLHVWQLVEFKHVKQLFRPGVQAVDVLMFSRVDNNVM